MTPQQYPTEYHIEPSLRRSCWYGILGAVLVCVTFVYVCNIANRDIAGLIVGLILIGSLIGALCLALRWKVVVDSRGISRRRFFRDDVWTWKDFADGRICKLQGHTLLDPARPWWLRKLKLDYIESSEIRELFTRINEHYKLPPPPELPEKLALKYGFRCSVDMDRNGITLTKGNDTFVYLWHEVRMAHIERSDPVRRDFKSLMLALPDREIELRYVTHQGGTSPTWRGATSEEIGEFLIRYLAPEQIDTTISGDPLANRELIERKLKEARKSIRDLMICMGILLPMLAGVLIYMAIDEGVMKPLVLGAFGALNIGPILYFIHRENRKRIRELEERLESIPDCG